MTDLTSQKPISSMYEDEGIGSDSSFFSNGCSFDPIPDVKFVDSLPVELLCIKCNDSLINAVQTECGHRLCGKCAHSLRLVDPAMCPKNEEDCTIVRKVTPDRFVRNQLLKRQVYCVNKDFGCTERVKLKEIEDHRSRCPEEKIECSYRCEGLIARKNLESHQRTCDFQPWTCPDCGASDLKLGNRKKHESEECPNRATQRCPFGCSDKYSQQALVKHIRECLNRPSKCSHQLCAFEGTRSELESHEQTQEAFHLLLKLQFELDTVKKNYEESIQANMTRIESVETASQQQGTTFSRNIEQVKQSLKDGGSVVEELKKQMETQREAMERRLDTLQQDLLRLQRAPSASISAPSFAPNGRETDERDLPSFESKFVWVLDNYRRQKKESLGTSGRPPQSLYSPPFYTSRFGYKMCARLYLNGDGSGKGTHISLFFAVMKGHYDSLLPWPFQQEVKLILLAQDRSNQHIKESFMPDPHSNSFKCPTDVMNVASGCPKFVEFTAAESTRYLKDDTLIFKVEVSKRGLTN